MGNTLRAEISYVIRKKRHISNCALMHKVVVTQKKSSYIKIYLIQNIKNKLNREIFILYCAIKYV